MIGESLSTPSVSVIIPTRDAEDTLPEALDSVARQDYSGSIEVIVADGSESSATAQMLRRHYPAVKIAFNGDHTIANGLNSALRAATGELIVRCDSYAKLSPDYVRRAVATFARTEAANVGGRQCPVATTLFEDAVALATTSFLGTGGARYRMGKTEGPTDTVYLGVWPRKVLDAVGGFDPTFLRNEDYELNWRLRQQGGTVWFDPELSATYRPRGNLRELARQYFNYGRWKSAMLLVHPFSVKARQLAAPLLVLGLAVSGALALIGAPWAAAALPLGYLLTIIIGALAVGMGHRGRAIVLVPLVLATIHLCWGVGFLLPARRSRRGP